MEKSKDNKMSIVNTSGNNINNVKNEKEPSHIMEGEYVALMETNDKECESWYFFIRKEGNEDNLKHLQNQLEKVDWYIIDDISTFDLDLDHPVSAKTAKEMTKIDLNSYSFHRKFDGKLDKINLGFNKRDDNDTKICKTFDQLGYGQIEDFISDEDLDSEDLTDTESIDDDSEDSEGSRKSDDSEDSRNSDVSEDSRNSDISDDSDVSDDSEDSRKSSCSEDLDNKTKNYKDSETLNSSENEKNINNKYSDKTKKNKKSNNIPSSLLNNNLPGWVKAKRKGK